MKDTFLGIDIGTTAIKFGVIEEGQLITQNSVNVKTYFGDNGARVQKADELIEALCDGILAIPETIRNRVNKISFSTAMHSCMPMVEGVANKIFIWSDSQAAGAIEKFKENSDAKRFYLKTGTPIHSMSPFAKIMYFKEQHSYPEATKWYGIKELILHLFTGQYLIDYSTASATGLLNLNTLRWDEEILAYLKISEENLAALVDTTAKFPIAEAVAKKLGLSKDVQIFAGASDGCLAAYASFVATRIPNSLTIGTSAAIRKVTRETSFDVKRQNFCYYLNQDYYVIGAPSNNGGCVLEWAGKTLFDDAESFFKALPEKLAQSPIGARGLRFYPYINGERAPYWRADKKAEFKNLSINHTKSDIVRSLVEGVLMNIRTLNVMIGNNDELSLSGGFFKTPVLCQMTADVLGADCWLSEFNEPIFGLYFLLNDEEFTAEVPMVEIAGDKANQAAYEALYLHYFE